MEVAGAVTTQVRDDLVDVCDPRVVHLAELLLDLFLEVWIVEDTERQAVLLAQERMILVEAVEVALVQFLYEDVAHGRLLQCREILSFLHCLVRFSFVPTIHHGRLFLKPQVCHLLSERAQEVEIVVLIDLVVLLNEVREVVLRVVVLLDVFQEAACFGLLETAHRVLEHVLSALFVVDVDLLKEVLWEAGRALLREEYQG